jgi:methyl-accepting chemotaxis protein
MVGQAGKTMSEIVSAIKRVADIVGEISAASAGQSAGVTQVGQAATQMVMAPHLAAGAGDQRIQGRRTWRRQPPGG